MATTEGHGNRGHTRLPHGGDGGSLPLGRNSPVGPGGEDARQPLPAGAGEAMCKLDSHTFLYVQFATGLFWITQVCLL